MLCAEARLVCGDVLDIMTSNESDAMMATWRTTLTIDNDIADYLREQSRLHEKSFKQVVNETLRRGMSPSANEKPRKPFKVSPIPGGFAPGVDPDNPNGNLEPT